MARDGKGIGGKLFEAGTRLVSRAAERVLSDPRGQEAVARAVGLAQRGRRRMEEVQQRLMKAAGIPARQEYDDLVKQLARIKRKARELGERLEADGAHDEDESPPAGPPGNGSAQH
jgi:hypothetical protein